MNGQYNRTISLLRLFAVIIIFMGVLGFGYVGIFLFAFISGAPNWFSQNIAPDAIRSSISSPLWIFGGIILLIFSRRIASFIVKKCDSVED